MRMTKNTTDVTNKFHVASMIEILVDARSYQYCSLESCIKTKYFSKLVYLKVGGLYMCMMYVCVHFVCMYVCNSFVYVLMQVCM